VRLYSFRITPSFLNLILNDLECGGGDSGDDGAIIRKLLRNSIVLTCAVGGGGSCGCDEDDTKDSTKLTGIRECSLSGQRRTTCVLGG